MKFQTHKIVALTCLMVLAAVVAHVAKPTQLMAQVYPREPLVSEVPQTFRHWSLSPTNVAAVVDPTQQSVLEYLYAETLGANYVNAKHQVVMLSLAYGKVQSDGSDVHKPDLCYPAQGFRILEEKNFPLALDANRTISVRYLKTQNGSRVEPLLYWTTAGDYLYQSKIQKKLIGFKYSRDNLIPDGLVLRVSTIDTDSAAAIDLLSNFIKEWYTSMPETKRVRYFGALNG